MTTPAIVTMAEINGSCSTGEAALFPLDLEVEVEVEEEEEELAPVTKARDALEDVVVEDVLLVPLGQMFISRLLPSAKSAAEQFSRQAPREFWTAVLVQRQVTLVMVLQTL